MILGMFRGINKVIEDHVETLTRKELEKAIWANARLNNRTGELTSGVTVILYFILSYFINKFYCVLTYYNCSQCTMIESLNVSSPTQLVRTLITSSLTV